LTGWEVLAREENSTLEVKICPAQLPGILILKIKLNCFFQVLDDFFNSFSLTCNIKLRTPGNILFSFLLDDS
jgi:hypothetical protein